MTFGATFVITAIDSDSVNSVGNAQNNFIPIFSSKSVMVRNTVTTTSRSIIIIVVMTIKDVCGGTIWTYDSNE